MYISDTLTVETRKNYHGGCRNITIKDFVIWADVAHPIMIGLHSETSEDELIDNVLYDGVEILEHAENQIDYQGCIGINNGDNITVKNVRFENLTINGKLISDDMPGKPRWYKTADMANIYVNDHVEGLTFSK